MEQKIIKYEPQIASVYKKIREEISVSENLDELKELKQRAKAWDAYWSRYYKDSGKGLEVQNLGAELKLRAERRMGELLPKIITDKGGRPPKNRFLDVTGLDDLGISKKQSSRYQRLAKIPRKTFEEFFLNARSKFKEITTSGLISYGTESSIGDEWQTPDVIIEAVKEVLGTIDLDPASTKEANESVKAKKFYTKEDDGLEQAWFGKVFLNPPYSFPLVKKFIEKLKENYKEEKITEAISLVNNCTDTEWFQGLLKEFPACFIQRRLPFEYQKEKFLTRQGQVIFYLGNNLEKFKEVFSKFGTIVQAI